MRTKAFGFLLLGSAACVIDPHYEDKVLPYGGDAALVESSTYITHTSSEMIFETSVVVLNSFYEGFDNEYLGADDFQIGGYEGTYSVEAFNGVHLERPATASSIVFLIDQSGTYENVDPYNTRLQAISKFFHDIVPPNTFIMGASARQGTLTTEPLEVSSTVFANDWRANGDYLFDLSHRTGGENAMADAADEAVDLLLQKTGPVRKEMVLLVHGSQDNSITPYEDLIAKARANSIAIHVVALGEEPDLNDLGMLSRETGGLFVACSTVKQMVKVFSELERLMNGALYVYKLRVRFKPSQGLVEPGSGWLHHIEINDPYGETFYNSIPVNIMIPS
ncbi:MAG: vWA domain-containing protein [Cyclobacteriaceae bacterium]